MSAAGTPPARPRAPEAVDPSRARSAFFYTWHHAYWGLPEIPGLVRYSIRGDLHRARSWSRSPSAYAPGTVVRFSARGDRTRTRGRRPLASR